MNVRGNNSSWLACLVIISLFVTLSVAFGETAKKGTKKNTPAKTSEKDTKQNKQEDSTPKLTKADWKSIQFSVYNKRENTNHIFVVKIGDSFEIPKTDVKIHVNEALINPLEPGSPAVNIVASQRNEVLYSGLLYRNIPVNLFEKLRYSGAQDLNIQFVIGHPSISLSPITNSFTTDKDGKLFLIYKGSLYFKLDESGDKWDRVMQNVRAIATAPNNSNILYVVTYNNAVQKSMDGGKNWLTINNGLPSNTGFINIIVNPHNSQEVFVLTNSGLFKTTDAGFSWDQTSLRDGVLQLLIHPKDKSIYYARTASGPYISKDAGASWSRIDNALPKKVVKGKGRTAEQLPVTVQSLALQSNSSPNLLAITEENGILRSDDHGSTWKEFNNGFQKSDGAYSILTTHSDIYIGSYGAIYHLKNGSVGWDKLSISKNDENAVASINSIFTLGDDKGFIITDSNGKIIYLDKDKKIIGLNYGVMPHTKIMAVSTVMVDGKPKVYAFINNTNFTDIKNYGLFYSEDNGTSWKESFSYEKPFYDSAIKIVVSPHNNSEIRVFDGQYNKGHSVTFDGGKSWSNFTLGLKYGNDATYAFVHDPIDKSIIYACTGVNESLLYKYKQIGGSNDGKWVPLNVVSKKVIVNQEDNNKVLTSSFKLSTDGGWTWQDISESLKGLDKNIDDGFRSIEMSPMYFKGNDIILYVVRYDSPYRYQQSTYIVASKDLGKSWEILRKQFEEYRFIYFNPFDENNIFIAYEDKMKNEETNREYKVLRISQSLDRGRTWKPFALYTPKNDINVSITISKADDKYAVYIGTSDGLYKTIDNGQTWTMVGGIKADGNNLLIARPELLDGMLKLDEKAFSKYIVRREDTVYIHANNTKMKRLADNNPLFVKVNISLTSKGDIKAMQVLSTIDSMYAAYNNDIKNSVLNNIKRNWEFKSFADMDINGEVEGIVSVRVKFTGGF